MIHGPYFEDTLVGSKVLPFLLREQASLIEAGHCAPEFVLCNEHRVVSLWDDDKPVCATVWQYYPNSKSAWSYLLVTHKDYWRQGLYTKIHEALSQRMVELGVMIRHSEQWLTNGKIFDAAGKNGMRPYLFRMKKDL